MSEQYLKNGFLFNAPDSKKQEFMIFSIMVTGKSADRTWDVVDIFLSLVNAETPFKTVEKMLEGGRLTACLKRAKTGQYKRLSKGLPQLIQLDVNECTIKQLEEVHGVGKKTSRFYKLYTDPEFSGIPLDTHLLKFLNDIGIEAPKNTPSSTKKYNLLENKLIELHKKSKEYTGLDSLQDFDYYIWWHYYKGEQDLIIRDFKSFYSSNGNFKDWV